MAPDYTDGEDWLEDLVGEETCANVSIVNDSTQWDWMVYFWRMGHVDH